jgi:hypothetical protein
VKGGGHASNPGFSSTDGVHIAMSRFDDVVYDSSTGLAEVGPGLIWDDVYEALQAYGVNVVGGRVPGVGVAGFTLGGGESSPPCPTSNPRRVDIWKTRERADALTRLLLVDQPIRFDD